MADYGALVIRGDGVIETCGAFIKTVSQEEYELRRDVFKYDFVSAAISALGTLDRLAHVRGSGLNKNGNCTNSSGGTAMRSTIPASHGCEL